MIQRIQTVYLIVGAGLVAAGWFIGQPSTSPAASFGWFVPAVTAAAALSVLAGVVGIVSYGNRKRQRGIVLAAQLFAVLCGAVVVLGQYLTSSLPTMEGVGTAATMAVALPLTGYVAFRLARRSIEKDIKLIQSMDRLR